MSRRRLRQINKQRQETALITAGEIAERRMLGQTGAEIAEELGLSQRTVWRALRRMAGEAQTTAKEYEAYREQQKEELEELRRVTLNSEQYTDEVRTKLLLRIHDRLARLLGTNAEQRSRVDVNVNLKRPADMTNEELVSTLMGGLDDANYQKAIDFILELKAQQAPMLEAGEVEEEEPGHPGGSYHR